MGDSGDNARAMGGHGDSCDCLAVRRQRPKWGCSLQHQRCPLFGYDGDSDTDLSDINVVKRSSFGAGQTMEGGEVIPEHPGYVSVDKATIEIGNILKFRSSLKTTLTTPQISETVTEV